MKMRLALLGLAMLWLGQNPASAAQPIDCAAAASPAQTTLCAHPVLVALDRELTDLVARHEAANQKRPQRVLRLARQMERHARDLDRCGADLACIGTHYAGWIDWLRQQTGDAPRDWTATRAELAALTGEARRSAGSRLLAPGEVPHPLVGFWRGDFDCRLAGRSGPLEFVFDSGFAGTVVGFMAAWTADKGPLDAAKRGDLGIGGTGEANRWQFGLGNSRIATSSPGMSFTSGTIALDAAGETLSGTFDGAQCDPFTLKRTDRSEGLDAVLAWVDSHANGRSIWDWPFVAAHFPEPGLFAFCGEMIGWMRLIHADYPEALVGRMGGDVIAEKAVALLDDPRFLALAGRPFDELADVERQALDDRMKRECMQNPIIRRSMMSSQGVLHPLGAREGTHPFAAVMDRLKLVRAARAWRDDAAASVADPVADSYPKAVALGAEAEARLAVLMPGDLVRFNEALAVARRTAAPEFARSRIASIPIDRHDAATLAALAQALAELEPAFADMDPEVKSLIAAETRAIEDRILSTVMVREVDAIEGFGAGLAAMEAGRRWYVRYLVDYGRYEQRPMVAQMLEAFRDRRAGDAAAVADELAALIEAADTADAFQALSERYLVTAFDRENARIGAAIEDREAHFQRQQLLAGFSPYERSLADEDGVIVVPAHYPEPTEEEIRLAVAREYSRYGSGAADGSFTYGLIPETSVEMRIVDVKKQGCAPASGGGYICTRVLTLQMGMSRAMQGVLGNSIQGDIMQSVLDQANATRAEVLEEHLVLTPEGWRSMTAADAAARGIADSMQTVTDVVGGVACGLAELGDVGGC